MFLRKTQRKKDGKTHDYWSVVENKRVAGGTASVQRHVLYLGEINCSQALAWRRAIEVLDDDTGHPRTLTLFAEDVCASVASGRTRQSSSFACRTCDYADHGNGVPAGWLGSCGGSCSLTSSLGRPPRQRAAKEHAMGSRCCRCWSPTA